MRCNAPSTPCRSVSRRARRQSGRRSLPPEHHGGVAANGNGYVQGIMTRSFQTAQPEDSLVRTLGRISGGQGAQLVPVMQGERIVGIVTPQNLSQSMGLLNQSRRLRRPEDS